jgi:hypothetical protein
MVCAFLKYHSMRDSAQVTAPGAIINMIATATARPNKQNRIARSPMAAAHSALAALVV